MIRTLRSARKGLARPKALVVFLHGYGADGADLLGLADVLAPHLPKVAFLAPDAPEVCTGGGFGRQWFPIPWIDGSDQAVAEAGLDADEARAVLAGDRYAAEVRADEAQARAYGISGVPFFVVDGAYGVNGAQPVEALTQVLATAWAAGQPLVMAAAGGSGCDADGCSV